MQTVDGESHSQHGQQGTGGTVEIKGHIEMKTTAWLVHIPGHGLMSEFEPGSN